MSTSLRPFPVDDEEHIKQPGWGALTLCQMKAGGMTSGMITGTVCPKEVILNFN